MDRQIYEHYCSSGEYLHDLTTAVARLRTLMDDEQPLCAPEKGAVVFDIDETILFNARFHQHNCYEDAAQRRHYQEVLASLDLAPPVPGMVSIVRACKDKGLRVFLLTGRSYQLRDVTIRNLEQYNVTYDRLYFYPNTLCTCVCKFKSAIRQGITREYNLHWCVGDQFSDLVGGYSRSYYRLPSFYESCCDHVNLKSSRSACMFYDKI